MDTSAAVTTRSCGASQANCVSTMATIIHTGITAIRTAMATSTVAADPGCTMKATLAG